VNCPLPPPTVQRKTDANPDGFDLDHLGSITSGKTRSPATSRCTGTKSTIVGRCDEDLVLERAEELKTQAKTAESILDKSILEERIGKLTGGIAKLIVVGSSAGEIREARTARRTRCARCRAP
jgi:hypothetical protein